jgi:hypothetical protein
MRIFTATLTALLLAAPLAAQAPAADSASMDALRRELLEMGRLDQEVREGFSPQSVQDTAYMRRMMRVDSAHTARIREIMATHGWPGISRVGPEAANAAFLLVQHTADNALQAEALGLMQAAPPGEVSLPDLALLTDRVRVRQGLPQLYGSQFSASSPFFSAPLRETLSRDCTANWRIRYYRLLHSVWLETSSAAPSMLAVPFSTDTE